MSDVTRIAIVCGGAALIGQAIVTALSDHGYFVVLADIDEARGQQVAQQRGANVEFIKLDVADDASIATFAHIIAQRFGRVHSLVNNAVSYEDAGLTSDRAAWHRALDINLVGAALLIGALRPLLAPGASVVNLGSVGGKVGARNRLLYPSSKAAVLQMTRTLAVELAADRIRVNSVSPGWTWSDAMVTMSGNDRAMADRAAAHVVPLGHVGDPADVANAVAYLCSDLAGFITGTDLAVDGGFMATGPDQGMGPRHWFNREKQKGPD